jgi:hypothetical protein
MHRFTATCFMALALAGCGPGGDEETTTGPTGDPGTTHASEHTGTSTTGEPVTTGGPETGGTDSQGQTTGAPETTGSTGETGTTGGLCDGFVPPGCVQTGTCPEGQVCQQIKEECVPSQCDCDPQTGDVVCTPDCGGGSCVPGCPDILCDLFCEFGFKLDENGCEICECNPPPNCGCQEDADCVKTSSGCCPCSMGGDEVPSHKDCVDQVMKCDLPPDEVACLQVFLCTEAQPACVQGQCVLK